MQKFLEQLSQFKEPGFRYDDGDINFSIQFLDLKNSLDYEFQIEIGNSHTLQEILKNKKDFLFALQEYILNFSKVIPDFFIYFGKHFNLIDKVKEHIDTLNIRIGISKKYATFSEPEFTINKGYTFYFSNILDPEKITVIINEKIGDEKIDESFRQVVSKLKNYFEMRFVNLKYNLNAMFEEISHKDFEYNLSFDNDKIIMDTLKDVLPPILNDLLLKENFTFYLAGEIKGATVDSDTTFPSIYGALLDLSKDGKKGMINIDLDRVFKIFNEVYKDKFQDKYDMLFQLLDILNFSKLKIKFSLLETLDLEQARNQFYPVKKIDEKEKYSYLYFDVAKQDTLSFDFLKEDNTIVINFIYNKDKGMDLIQNSLKFGKKIITKLC